MEKLLDRVARFYDDLFMEVVYRAHHNSFKVSFADVFYNDFIDYIVVACGLKRRIFLAIPTRGGRRFDTCMRGGRSSSNISRSPVRRGGIICSAILGGAQASGSPS